MTVQVTNSICYENQRYSIIAQQNELDYNPEIYGVKPDTGCSACWRGYFCEFGIIYKQLIIIDWNILSSSDNTLPIVENIQAVKSNGMWQYVALNARVDYSGGLVLGAGFIDTYYIHMGYQQVYAYKTVIELIFEKGILIEKIDQSAKFELIRENIRNSHEELKHNMIGNIDAFFSLQYSKKWSRYK